MKYLQMEDRSAEYRAVLSLSAAELKIIRAAVSDMKTVYRSKAQKHRIFPAARSKSMYDLTYQRLSEMLDPLDQAMKTLEYPNKKRQEGRCKSGFHKWYYATRKPLRVCDACKLREDLPEIAKN